MTPDEFAAVYPLVLDWIQQTIAKHEHSGKIVGARGFKRLPLYFSQEHDESHYHQPSSDPTTVINGTASFWRF